jgi:hypothetical protein
VDKPYLLAGRAGGALRTGRGLDDGDGAGAAFSKRRRPISTKGEPVPHNDLLVSICKPIGVEATTFGDPLYCTGPLAGLA